MTSMLFNLFSNNNKCKHTNITPLSAGSYCPDCGKEIQIDWMLLRCSCCNSKREARIIFNSIKPKSKYCIKCGSPECYVEKKETIEYFDVHYAVISKKEAACDINKNEILQIWVEQEHKKSDLFSNLRLIPLLVK